MNNVIETGEDVTSDYHHWITNAHVSEANDQIKHLKYSKDWKGFRILPGPPRTTEKTTVEELRKQEIVGIYAISDKPVMKEHVKKLTELRKKHLMDGVRKLEARKKAWELSRA